MATVSAKMWMKPIKIEVFFINRQTKFVKKNNGNMANMAHGYDHVDFIIHVKSAVVDDKMRKCMGPTKTTTRMSPTRLVCFLLFADPESLNILVG